MLKLLKDFKKDFYMTKRRNEAGNVLFLILIAVALFAALSYAVTQSSRSGAGGTDGESALVNSATVTQYPASVRTAIVRMIINGTTIDQMNFDPPSQFSSTCDAAPAACVFHTSGGGATRVTAPPDVMASATQGQWIFAANYQINQIGTSGAAATNTDVIAFLPGISQGICSRLNEELGITFVAADDGDSDGIPDAEASTIPDEDDEKNSVSAAGLTIAAAGANNTLDGVFAGQPFGCADFNDTNNAADDSDLAYYHVLVER